MSVWLAQLVRALAAPTHVRSYVQEVRFNSLEILSFDLLCHDSKIRFFITYRPVYRDIAAVRYLQLLVECLEEYANCNQTMQCNCW